MYYLEAFLCFVWAAMISLFAIPSIIYVAHLKNLLDKPNQRTMHSLLTPRLGGLAIFAGMISSLMIFGKINNSVQFLLGALIIIYYIGLKDDIVSVSAFKKFFVQILGAGIVIFMGDIRITSFQGILGIYMLPDGISYAFSFLMILGITNSINLIDGLDGLAGSIISVILGSFGVFFFLHGGDSFMPSAFVAFSLAGSIIGFLRYNIFKATIFMGDTGSLVSGFTVAVLSVQFIEMKVVESSPSIMLAILIIPLFDTVRVFLLRILRGVSPFSPDKNHIHHILTGVGCSQLQTVFILIAINILFISSAYFIKQYGDHVIILFLGIVVFVAAIILYLLDKKRNKKSV
ncbi:MAG: hypothetical protein RLZZ175_2661 [Bacteroidota bacterium]|jgi:UDP-GlcNAc:undecaprenyl-phosphate GlcNAc-1-phosphate transferase